MKLNPSVITVSLMLVLILASGADAPPEGNSRIVGKVMNQRGQTIPNLLVKLIIPRGMKDRFPTTQPLKGGKNAYIEGISDQQGDFKFEKLPAGDYALTSELDGTGRGRVEVTLGKNQTGTVQIVLKSRRGEKQ